MPQYLEMSCYLHTQTRSNIQLIKTTKCDSIEVLFGETSVFSETRDPDTPDRASNSTGEREGPATTLGSVPKK